MEQPSRYTLLGAWMAARDNEKILIQKQRLKKEGKGKYPRYFVALPDKRGRIIRRWVKDDAWKRQRTKEKKIQLQRKIRARKSYLARAKKYKFRTTLPTLKKFTRRPTAFKRRERDIVIKPKQFEPRPDLKKYAIFWSFENPSFSPLARGAGSHLALAPKTVKNPLPEDFATAIIGKSIMKFTQARGIPFDTDWLKRESGESVRVLVKVNVSTSRSARIEFNGSAIIWSPTPILRYPFTNV